MDEKAMVLKEEQILEYTPPAACAPLLRMEWISGSPHRFGWHATVELMAAIAGDVTLYAGGQRYTLCEGDLLLIGPNCGHFYHPLRKESRALILEVGASFLDRRHLPTLPNEAVLLCDSAGQEDLHQMLSAIGRYVYEGGELNCLAAEATTILLFVEIARILASSGRGDTVMRTQVSQAENPLIESAISYIEHHCCGELALEDIASFAGCSKTYLSSLFKRKTGLSPSDYIARLRVRRAVDLLGSSKKSITDIALECGFPDNRSLANATKKYCGMTPQEYRHRMK